MLVWVTLSAGVVALGGAVAFKRKRETRAARTNAPATPVTARAIDLSFPTQPIAAAVPATPQPVARPLPGALLATPVLPETPEGARLRPATAANELEKSRLLDEVVAALGKIPPLPRAVHAILRELNTMGSTARSVASIVGTEPVLVASLLRMVNSAAFGLRREILSLDEAVAYLGFSTVKALVVRLRLGPLLAGGSGARKGNGYDPEQLWLHSVAVGQAAEALAKRVGGVDPWLASTIGLLHDIGKLAINSTFPHVVGQLWSTDNYGDESFLARERRLFGADHAFIGGVLATRWKLPNDLVEAIRLHHMPEGNSDVLAMPPKLFRAVCVVHVANQLVKYCHVYCSNMEIDIVPEPVLRELGLSGDLEALLDRETRQMIESTVRLMRMPIAKASPTRARRAA